MKKFAFVFFLLIFLYSSYSAYSAMMPEKTSYIFSYDNLLGVIKNERVGLLDISRLKEGTAINVFNYNLRKAKGKPVKLGQELIVVVDEGIVFLSPQLEERQLIRIEGKVYKILEEEDRVYVFTNNRLYVIERVKSFLEGNESFVIANNTSINSKETYHLDAEILNGKIYLLVNDKIKVVDQKNLSIIKEEQVGENLGLLEKVGSYVVFFDIGGNLYKYSYGKGLWKIGYFRDPFRVKRVGNSLVVLTTSGRVYVYEEVFDIPGKLGRWKAEYYLGDAIYKDIYKRGEDYIVVGRRSIYTFRTTEPYPYVEKELKANIISTTFVGEKLLVLTDNNELYLFEENELRKGCYIVKPREYETIGYIDVDLVVYSKEKPEVYFGRRNIKMEKRGDLYTAKINPEEYDFGKIIVECSTGEEPTAKTTIFRGEEGPVGSFIVEMPEEVEEGQLINITVRNQYGEEVENFTLSFTRNLVFTNNPVEVKLGAGEYIVVINKRGYITFSQKLLVKESLLTFLAKVIAGLAILIGVIYFLYKKGIISNFIKNIKKRVEK